METSERFSQLRRGLLEFLALKIIAGGEVYAADILAQLNQTDFATQEGTLYPLLSKLRREGWVEYEWQESETGPPRKYYRLTKGGQGQLKETKHYWHHIIKTVDELGT
jgi:PadR family transcriptional regulator PadR